MLWNWAASLLQLSLNCLMMLETFSKRCTSWCCLRWQWLMMRKVAFSKSRTSLASMMLVNCWRLVSSCWTLGTNVYTMEDHAL
uniref:Putative secreted protein n=1 Tax=Ixodes ricinus TaxID=34613 RepID=A0A6B0U2Z2_IXORI